MRDYAWMYEYCLNRFGSRGAGSAPAAAEERRRAVRAGRRPLPVADQCGSSARRPQSTAWWTPSGQPSRSVLRLRSAEGRAHERRASRAADAGRPPDPPPGQAQERAAQCADGARPGPRAWQLQQLPRGLAGNRHRRPVEAAVKRGNQLGGLSAPRFLRMAGKDTFIPSDDMVAALKTQEIIDKPPTSLRDLAAVQEPSTSGARRAAGRCASCR